jgi:hypothetical protein
MCWLWLKKIDRYDKCLIVWRLKTKVLIFPIWFAEEGCFTWSFPGFVHLFSEKGSKRKAETYYILLQGARSHSIDSTISIAMTIQSMFLVRLVLNIHAQHTLFWAKCMIYLTLSAGIYRNTDETLWLSQPSIRAFFFSGVWSGITRWLW